jgi:putative ABC transport system ATP-binding protein
MASIEIHNVSKFYPRPEGRVTALNDIRLTVNSGELVTFQGPSGSGKSTLLLTIGGLLAPDQGEIRIDGQNLFAFNSENRARFRSTNIGFVFQQFYLVPYLDVLENVLAPTLAAPSQNSLPRAEALLEEMNLAHRKHHTPAELSTGEKQRTALARALINDPGVILADEPTGNLDAENAEIVMNGLAQYARRGKTVLLATHDFRGKVQPEKLFRIKDGMLSN